ncbi:branched-chain amino acid ABC transporter permease [Acidovorax sp. DW039]|uniref:branched-chain amino acid ABC transporter permease n=1 Tax=Acidovorax sp. DW039 TaxID=3095606 RepID=UPI00308599E1|nr:branched-chain amino acid ABC transporter permease [Acidovorax sp. DW039]
MIAYLCAIGIVALIYCLLALGLNLQFGLTRLVNFGVVAFFAVGAYTSGLLALQGVPLVLCFVAAGVLAGVLALPIGLLSLRLRDDYLAIVTLGFSEAVRISIQQESWLTKGVQGLPGLPKLFASWGSGVSDVAIFATLLALVALVAWGTVRLAASPFGRLLKAIGDDEAALSALGKDPAWFKVQVFMLGAALAGLAGAFYAHFITFITPEQFIPLITFYVWMGLVMGGSGTVRGAVFGSLLLMVFLEGSRFAKDWVPGVSEVGMASLRLAAVGLALILVTLYKPNGLFGGSAGSAK